MQTTVGQLMINSVLPAHLRDYSRVLDKAGIGALMELVEQEKDPDLYRNVVHALHKVGSDSAQSTGSSFSIYDLRTPPKTKRMMDALKQKVTATVERDDLTSRQKEEAITHMVTNAAPVIDTTLYSEALALNNPFALQVKSGSRGKLGDLRSLLVGDLLVSDHKDRTISMPLLNSYAAGTDTAEYWAGSYGARKGGISTKLCLAEGTLVRMADYSVRAIETITAGEYIMGADVDLKLIPVCVRNVFNNGLRDCFRYDFKINQSGNVIHITATADHKVLATRQFSGRRGYRTETNMWPLRYAVRENGTPNKTFSLQLAAGSIGSGGIYEPRALLLGLMLGDGCTPVGACATYDLEVDHPLHRFVLANGAIVSNSTQEAGFLAKQLIQASHRQIVTLDDCETARGIPVEVDDADNVGTVLADAVGPIPAGTIIDPRIQRQLKAIASRRKDSTIIVRSPLTCSASDGVCSKCVGIRERGVLPEIGDNVGIAAAQSLTEPLSQAMLNVKHEGGRTKRDAVKGQLTGFPLINQLVQVPKSFQGGAAVAATDGTVQAVRAAPQGGSLITINGQEHYAPIGADVTVKPGERVEAGDLLSSGIPNPGELVRHRGIGAGRLDFVNILRNAYRDSGLKASRRNIELLARGLINHVRVLDLDGVDNALPDDTVEYNTLERTYRPRYGFRVTKPTAAIGAYLEKPTRQYTIGTRLTKNVANDLKLHGINEVTTHNDAPAFEPEMVRAMQQLSLSPDWQVRMGGSYLERGLLEALHRGRGSAAAGTSYIPSLARGVDFAGDLGSGGNY